MNFAQGDILACRANIFSSGGTVVSIWKELTNPSSFAGEYDTVNAALPPINALPRANVPPTNANRMESVIGPGVVFEGNFTGDGDMRVAGRIQGDLRLKDNLTLDPGAHIVGTVNANSVTIGGQVEGNIQASGHVKLLESGQLIGDVKAKFVVAALGSRMRGHVEFGWDDPDLRTTEKSVTTPANGAQPWVNANPV
jgi:cytoskeletal protein CcmA (bactofilin family)